MESMDLDSKTEPEPGPATSITQKLAAIGGRLLSVATLILLFVVTYQHLGGLSWEGGAHFFNCHPFFMILGVAFFLTNGVLSWRDVPLGHGITKIIHVTFNVLALGCLAIGLYVTIAANKSPHIVSLHSWVALSSVLLFTIQALGGLFFYAIPIFPFSVRARILPLHAWLGVVSWTLLMFTLIIGIVEWMAFRSRGSRSAFNTTGFILANVLGLFILATTLAGLWSMLPRRNIAIDVEERDGAAIDDPSRTRLKGRYATSTQMSRPYVSETANPFATEPVPPRRGTIVEREATY